MIKHYIFEEIQHTLYKGNLDTPGQFSSLGEPSNLKIKDHYYF